MASRKVLLAELRLREQQARKSANTMGDAYQCGIADAFHDARGLVEWNWPDRKRKRSTRKAAP